VLRVPPLANTQLFQEVVATNSQHLQRRFRMHQQRDDRGPVEDRSYPSGGHTVQAPVPARGDDGNHVQLVNCDIFSPVQAGLSEVTRRNLSMTVSHAETKLALPRSSEKHK
jgi:hypothetical protein